MAFNVAWELDESESVSADSLLGKIRLSDGSRSIVEDSVYLDSWMRALLEASRTAAEGGTMFDVDIVEEARPLHIRKDRAGGLQVRFGEKEVIADSVEAFMTAIRAAAGDFMRRTASIEGSNRNATLDQIYRLSASGREQQ